MQVFEELSKHPTIKKVLLGIQTLLDQPNISNNAQMAAHQAFRTNREHYDQRVRHQMLLLVRRANALIELDIAGKSQLALVKDVQKDPVHQIIEHIDLVVIKKGEKVQVDKDVDTEDEAAQDDED